MIKTIYAKDHDEWLTLRQGGIGSSEVGTILGVNPYDTPYQLWLRKTGQMPAKEENTAMRMGHLLEPVVAQLYEEQTGNKVIKKTAADFVVVNDYFPFMKASPDRYVHKGSRKGKMLLECKTTNLNVDEDNLPKSWFCQVQYLLACSGLEEGAIAWLKHGREFGYLPIVRDDDFVNFMLEKVDSFWQRSVVNGEPPSLDLTTDDVAFRFPSEQEGLSATATPEVYNNYKQLLEVRNKIDELEATKALIETRIKAHMGCAERLVFGDTVLATWKTYKGRTTIDAKALASAHPKIAQLYSKTTATTRRFAITQPK